MARSSSPDHVDNTWQTPSPDYYALSASGPPTWRTPMELIRGVAADGGPLAGCVDADAGYIASGYSFGGYTAYVTGGALVNDATYTPLYDLSDRAVRGGHLRALAAAGALTTGTAEIDVPVLTLGAARDGIVFTEYEFLHGAVTATPRVLASSRPAT